MTAHPYRYPLYAAGAWRGTCSCHRWQPLGTDPKLRPETVGGGK